MRDAPFAAPSLPRTFFARPTADLAIALLGTVLVRRWRDATTSVGLIVETEAYGGPEDLASHARFGRTRRNAAMFGPRGHAYVYRVYGLHTCLNVVGSPAGAAGAVLVRAVAPLDGIDALAARRATTTRLAPATVRLAAGPGNVGAAFGIDLDLDGVDLTIAGRLWLAHPVADLMETLLGRGVVCGRRIGVAYAGPEWAERPWRFGVRGHPSLSRPFPQAG
jgi:DNA-3-methyladenine glycosylase